MKKIVGIMIGLGLAFAANADVIVGYSIEDGTPLAADTLATDASGTDLSSPDFNLSGSYSAGTGYFNINETYGIADGISDDMAGAFSSGQFIGFAISTTSTESIQLGELQTTLLRASQGGCELVRMVSRVGLLIRVCPLTT